MIIRYDKRYFDDLVEIDYNSGLPYYDISNPSKSDLKKWFASRFKKGDEEFYLYKEGKDIVGAIAVKKEFLGLRGSCEIMYLSIHKNYHRKRIGTKLLKFLESKIRKQKFKRIYLITGKDKNKRAINFYKEYGYKRYAILKNHYRKGSHSIIMRKDLK